MSGIPIPEVLECMHFVSEGRKEQSRVVKNYEFDLYLGGSREILLDGVPYMVEEGSLIFRKPHQHTVGIGDYNMYLLTLDFCQAQKNDSLFFRGVDGECQPISDFRELEDIPAVFKPQHFEELCRLYEHLSHCSYPAAKDTKRQKEYIKEFLLLVLYDAQTHNRKKLFNSDGETDAVKLTHNYILEHFSEQITIKNIADSLYLNENYLIRIFKAQYGATPNKYLLETRLIHARYLLIYSNKTIKEIALSCGFNTTSYFIKKYKEYFLRTPLSFRKNLK